MSKIKSTRQTTMPTVTSFCCLALQRKDSEEALRGREETANQHVCITSIAQSGGIWRGFVTYRRIIAESVLEERSMLWSACRSCRNGIADTVVRRVCERLATLCNLKLAEGSGLDETYCISRVLNLLPLASQVAKDIGTKILSLECKTIRLFQPSCAIF